jgi:uncharacterized Fe-S cluster-containing radical SAM superfamily protein/predicted phosphodiesterase
MEGGRMSGLAQRAYDDAVLVFGGVYSNAQALDALFAFAQARGLPSRRWICTGDVIAYGADARACLDRLRASDALIVAGNCEEGLAAGAGDCGCGFAPGSSCDALSARWWAHAKAQLDADARAWLAGLPARAHVTINGRRLAVLHGAADETSRFVFGSSPRRVLAQEIAASGCDGVLAGHCGLPFTRIVEDKLWHNSGALGMPANDGTPRVWCSVVTPGARAGELCIEHVALDYDHAGAAAAMRAAGLPDDYARALQDGIWASCDILPKDEAKAAGVALNPRMLAWAPGVGELDWPRATDAPALAPGKFADPLRTQGGEPRAQVGLDALRTLWINTGTLCNLSCANCYIESTPRNDRLAWISAAEARAFYDEIAREALPTREIGFTGGEPFMNPEFIEMLGEALERGFKAIVLTNAMKPMQHKAEALARLNARHGDALTIRVSVDHYTQRLHEMERGPQSWAPTMDGLRWLADNGVRVHLAGRLYSGEVESLVRAGYARLCAQLGLTLDAHDPVALTLFPEMDARADVPEITQACWGLLGKSPSQMMCASSRMVVKRKGAGAPVVLACTLLAYDEAFEMGETLRAAARPVALNHPHCARFCVLGGAACSQG